MRQYAPHVIARRLTATLLSQFKLNTILLESCKNAYTQSVKGNYNCCLLAKHRLGCFLFKAPLPLRK